MTTLRCTCGARIEGAGVALLEAVEAHLEENHSPTRPQVRLADADGKAERAEERVLCVPNDQFGGTT